MPLPRWVAHLNKRVTNRLMEPLARRFDNFAIVHHSGRQSGATYTTPVNYFEAEAPYVIVALTYGPGADWVKNTAAGPASLELDGKLAAITRLEIIGRNEAWEFLPGIVRIVLRILRVRRFARLSCPDRFTSQ